MELEKKLLGFSVPVGPKLSLSLVNLSTWYLESNGFIGLSRHQKILPASVWGFNPLLVRRHEPVAGHDALCDLRIVNLEEEALLAQLRVPLLGDFIAWTANFHKLLHFHFDFLWGWLGWSLLGFFGCSPSQICLMLFSLSMRQVASLIVVKC